MEIRNLVNNKGNKVENQFVLNTAKGTYFKSYASVVAFVPKKGKPKFSTDWDYSNTTRRHLYKFLGDMGVGLHNGKEVKAAIKNKDAILVDSWSLEVE